MTIAPRLWLWLRIVYRDAYGSPLDARTAWTVAKLVHPRREVSP